MTANQLAAEKELGFTNKKKSNNPNIVNLSNRQKNLGILANATRDPDARKELLKQRNQIMNEITPKKSEEKHQRTLENIKEIEESRNESQRMYKAVKAIQSTTTQAQLYIEKEDGYTTNPEQQIEIITDFFRGMFSQKDLAKLSEIPPMKMEEPFTKSEIHQAVNSLKKTRAQE